ncbi:phage scaffolding protein [Clostridium sp. SYSU_GA19001]|uniref:phage scaffolding protein n=1 Tax=Clostridium caldaquaticum TaxID=2940653 RepID=UPI002076D6B2|nr:phage scaffolding protein [Clostridium caldaquaticum]MCM8710534.1 phage scaffolding protein [Clostridium caldaquaticum]
MEWLRKLLENAQIKDGKLDVEALMTSINSEFPKNAVPKDKFNEVSNDLKEANKILENLKKNHKDVEALQTEIENYKKKMKELETAREQDRKIYTIKSVLEKAGAIDVEYMIYKLGDISKLEMDAEGNIKDLDNKIKDLQANNSNFFKVLEGDNKNKPKVIENKLPEGTPSTDDNDVANVFAKALNGNFN